LNIIAVADEDTNILFQLLGIESFLIKSQDIAEFKKEFDQIIKIPNVGIIIINEQFLIRYRDYFKEIKTQKLPIIVEIPNIEGALSQQYFESFIKTLLGLEYVSKARD
jgi:vacuolar-type H+-ATPase subunit F/Vma7